jgi:hypothetical protein
MHIIWDFQNKLLIYPWFRDELADRLPSQEVQQSQSSNKVGTRGCVSITVA